MRTILNTCKYSDWNIVDDTAANGGNLTCKNTWTHGKSSNGIATETAEKWLQVLSSVRLMEYYPTLPINSANRKTYCEHLAFSRQRDQKLSVKHPCADVCITFMSQAFLLRCCVNLCWDAAQWRLPARVYHNKSLPIVPGMLLLWKFANQHWVRRLSICKRNSWASSSSLSLWWLFHIKSLLLVMLLIWREDICFCLNYKNQQ